MQKHSSRIGNAALAELGHSKPENHQHSRVGRTRQALGIIATGGSGLVHHIVFNCGNRTKSRQIRTMHDIRYSTMGLPWMCARVHNYTLQQNNTFFSLYFSSPLATLTDAARAKTVPNAIMLNIILLSMKL